MGEEPIEAPFYGSRLLPFFGRALLSFLGRAHEKVFPMVDFFQEVIEGALEGQKKPY
jgi:hypothetical protein